MSSTLVITPRLSISGSVQSWGFTATRERERPEMKAGTQTFCLTSQESFLTVYTHTHTPKAVLSASAVVPSL